MNENMNRSRITQLWNRYNSQTVLIILLLIYLSYLIFIATNLNYGISPDETAHLIFSKHFSTTWSIPPDSLETLKQGWYITHNPFLYHWINGRTINVIQLFAPNSTEWQITVVLRLFGVLWSLGTVIFSYLLSKEVLSGKWSQILPVFLLTNTLMFVFISGAVTYDNLANFLSMASIYFLVRVLKFKNFVMNSLLWIIFICLGTLVKYPVLPLALVLFCVWIIFFLMNRKKIEFSYKNSFQLYSFLFLALSLVVVNLYLYGGNLIKFGSITPDCQQLFSDDICDLSPFVQRHYEYGLEEKLTIMESIKTGFPHPVEYFFYDWVELMLSRIYGILAHINYFPSHIIIFYKLLFLWLLLLGFRYWKGPSFTIISLILIFGFYTLTLFLKNYNTELVYGFKNIALQGRYIFPVIGIFYVLIGYIVEITQNIFLKYSTTVLMAILFLVGGPLKFIYRYNLIFSDWFK